jgi:hypothetical protein
VNPNGEVEFQNKSKADLPPTLTDQRTEEPAPLSPQAEQSEVSTPMSRFARANRGCQTEMTFQQLPERGVIQQEVILDEEKVAGELFSFDAGHDIVSTQGERHRRDKSHVGDRRS